MFEAISEVKKAYLKELMEKGQREDGRKALEYRAFSVEPNVIPRAEGSAVAKIGETTVYAGIKFGVGEPYPDSPDAGVMMTGAELVPLADPEYRSGPPGEDAVELARVVDRGIRESGAIDFKELCVRENELVYILFFDLHIINNDGNLLDTSTLALMKALSETRLPKVEEDKIVTGEYSGKLKLHQKPVSCTFGKLGATVFLDPSLDEEQSLDGRYTIATTEKNVTAVQKAGSGGFSEKDLDLILDTAFAKGKELRKVL